MRTFDKIRLENTLKTAIYKAVNPHIWTHGVDYTNKYADANVDTEALALIVDCLNDISADCQALLNRVLEY